jgi:hypothetical protein
MNGKEVLVSNKGIRDIVSGNKARVNLAEVLRVYDKQ